MSHIYSSVLNSEHLTQAKFHSHGDPEGIRAHDSWEGAPHPGLGMHVREVGVPQCVL